MDLRKAFRSHGLPEEGDMGRAFYAIICYCLRGQDTSEAPDAPLEQNAVLLGNPNGLQLVKLLEQLFEEDQRDATK